MSEFQCETSQNILVTLDFAAESRDIVEMVLRKISDSGPHFVIGAGLSGLAAALEFEAHGESCVVLEASDRIGGKLETTVVEDNYLLDRGFQVLLPSYPEVKSLGDISALDLQFFASGAKLETTSGSILMADPLRHPEVLMSTAFGRYATIKDKWLVVRLQQSLRWMSEDDLIGPKALAHHALGRSNQTTAEFLKSYGFSDEIVANFWGPFLAGIFLENELKTSACFFQYLVKMFSASPVAVPRRGVGELPRLMAARLKKSEIRLKTRVQNVDQNRIHLADGTSIAAKSVIQLTQGTTGEGATGPFGRVTTLWFQASEPPFEGPWLSLNSHKKKQNINHVAVLSNVSRDYAPKGDALISVNVIGSLSSETVPKVLSGGLPAVLSEAETLYGSSVKTWRLLRTDQIDRPFPLYLGRSDADTPSQQGSLLRGRNAARIALGRL